MPNNWKTHSNKKKKVEEKEEEPQRTPRKRRKSVEVCLGLELIVDVEEEEPGDGGDGRRTVGMKREIC